MDFFKRAAELQEETVENRRYLHQNAEVGLELPRTKKYIMEKFKRIWNGTAGMWTWCCGNGWQKDKRESHSFESGHGCIADGRTEWTSGLLVRQGQKHILADMILIRRCC